MNAASKSTILYIDDDTDDCFFLKTSMQEAGNKAELIYATGGEEAVNYLNSITPDSFPNLIVLDLNMPGWDGQSTLFYLKSHLDFAAIPVVILSTSDDKNEKEACKQMGAMSYYQKPDHFDGYRRIVANLFSFIKE